MKASERQFWDLYNLLDANIYLSPSRTKIELEYIEGVLPLEKYRHILDLQCGDGRIAIPLTKKGYKVTGLDYDKKALFRLQEKSNSLQKIINGNITSMPAIERIDAIIMVYAVMPVNLQLLPFFNSLAHLLRKGGRIIIDLLPKEYVRGIGQQESTLTEKYQVASDAYSNIHRIRSYIPESQVERSEFILETFGDNSKKIVFDHKVFGLKEVLTGADGAGLSVKQINGDFRGSKYVSGKSKRLILVMDKLR